jgi:hypothetical protein
MRFSQREMCVAIPLFFAVACEEGIAPETPLTFSFERGMDGWTAAAADTGDLGGAHARWVIERTTELAYDGQHALKFHMANNTDAAKIWIARPFSVTSGRSYDVDVSYAFGTRDWGDANLFVLLTGAFRVPPADGPSLLAGTTRDHTGNGAGSDVGFRWLRKHVEVSVPQNGSAVIYVVVGIWGTWEGSRTYYLDDLTVQLTLQ